MTPLTAKHFPVVDRLLASLVGRTTCSNGFETVKRLNPRPNQPMKNRRIPGRNTFGILKIPHFFLLTNLFRGLVGTFIHSCHIHMI